MAKEASIAERLEVRHMATMERTASVADVLLSGKRIAYVFYDAQRTVSFLPVAMHKIKLTPEQAKEVVDFAKGKADALAKAEAGDRSALAALGVT